MNEEAGPVMDPRHHWRDSGSRSPKCARWRASLRRESSKKNDAVPVPGARGSDRLSVTERSDATGHRSIFFSFPPRKTPGGGYPGPRTIPRRSRFPATAEP